MKILIKADNEIDEKTKTNKILFKISLHGNDTLIFRDDEIIFNSEKLVYNEYTEFKLIESYITPFVAIYYVKI